jgi:16S rRNA (guanine527-N7)-methyltransferase
MDGEQDDDGQDDPETVEPPAPAVRNAPAPRSTARPAPAATAAAQAVFGDRLALATRYAELLVGAGTERGVIGPRETVRIWDRHLVNCALVTELLPADARLVDVGSGAGLPGLAAAIRAPHLTVNLVEPQERRCQFLREAVAALELAERVGVIRGVPTKRRCARRSAPPTG